MRLALHFRDKSNNVKPYRYFNIWRDSRADLEDRTAAASRCGDLASKLLAIIIGGRGTLSMATMTRLIRVSSCNTSSNQL